MRKAYRDFERIQKAPSRMRKDRNGREIGASNKVQQETANGQGDC